MTCPFCDPINIERQGIFQTKSEIVLHNLYPLTKGQVLVIPKRHVTSIRELTDSEAESLLRTVKLVSQKLKASLNPDGFNYGINEGSCAGQTVEHLHMHILPRFNADKIPHNHIFHKEKKPENLTQEEMRKAVEELRAVFNAI